MKKKANRCKPFSPRQQKKETGDYATAIIETMHESLLMLTESLRIRHANNGFYHSFKMQPEDIEGCFLYEVGDEQWNIPSLKEQMELLRKRNIPFMQLEVTCYFKSIGKRTLWLNANKFPMKEGNRKMILLAIQDITEQKLLQEHLEDNEERIQLLLQSASDIITVVDEKSMIKYESPAIMHVLGYIPEERIGKNIHSLVHPDDQVIKSTLLQTSIDNPKENITGEFRLRHKNGSYKTMEAVFRNQLYHRKINGIIVNYRDVTDRKLLEQHKDEFIGIASHELKTPVTSLKAYLQILEEYFLNQLDAGSAELLYKMNKQVDRLTILIRDLLDFTRIEGGQLKFREEEYELNEMVTEVAEELQRTTKQHRIKVSLDQPQIILGDRYRTAQVLTNLVNNAIKYSPKADLIVISTFISPSTATVSVQDFGVGIEQDLQKKVFDRFYRVAETSNHLFSGLGLGLYIAAEFIKRQGGQIWVESENGDGSTFSFSLPLG